MQVAAEAQLSWLHMPYVTSAKSGKIGVDQSIGSCDDPSAMRVYPCCIFLFVPG
jgi:hypothetical protein